MKQANFKTKNLLDLEADDLKICKTMNAKRVFQCKLYKSNIL